MVYILIVQLWLSVKSKQIINEINLNDGYPKPARSLWSGYGKRIKWLKQNKASLSTKEQKALLKLSAIEYSLYASVAALCGVYIAGIYE